MVGERYDSCKRKSLLLSSSVCLLSSVQFSPRWYLCARKSPYALHPVSQKFPQRCLWNSSNVRLTDDGPFSSFQGRSSSASSFNASLIQAINGVMFLALCPQVVSQASQNFGLSEKQTTSLLAKRPPVYLIGRFPSYFTGWGSEGVNYYLLLIKSVHKFYIFRLTCLFPWHPLCAKFTKTKWNRYQSCRYSELEELKIPQ